MLNDARGFTITSYHGHDNRAKAALLRPIHPVTKDLAILDNLRKVFEEDRRHITRHPILKHLFQRYDSLLNQTTCFGHPVAPVEPSQDFRDRVNQLIVDMHNKRIVIEKKRAREAQKKAAVYQSKSKGKRYFNKTKG